MSIEERMIEADAKLVLLEADIQRLIAAKIDEIPALMRKINLKDKSPVTEREMKMIIVFANYGIAKATGKMLRRMPA